MALFNIGKPKAFLGVDIGTAGVKLVQLQEEHGRAKLHTYAYTERGPNETATSLLDTPELTAGILKTMMKKAKTTATKVVTGLPISAIFSSVLSVPKLADKEQRGAIEVQARKLISVPLEEMILDHKILTTPEEIKAAGDKLKNIKVLLTAAPKSLVKKYMDVFKAAGLELASLETEAFALIRALVGKDKSTLMIIDVGALRTSVLVVMDGIPYLSRSIEVGGVRFTKAAAVALGVTDERAESMKGDIRSFGALPEGGIPKVFEPVAVQIANEIAFSLKLFAGLEEAQGKTVEKVILTGGGSLLPGLDAYLGQKLQLRVFRGDPWARVLYPEDARPLLDDIGPRYSVAVGLAMREFEK
jgi:type IV pilus assembly protein PilM